MSRAEGWYKDAVIYQLHVRSFFDSNGDGIGDFKGLAAKLDYLVDLGVTALWLLPFYPSPLRDDGYDIADYNAINPSYGSMADFKLFLREAHKRDLKVITELVINHTSDQHPWFQRARRAPVGSPARDYYVWSDTPEKYRGTRIIFQDFEPSNWTWDDVAGQYYWHRFYHHQPDLNFENPAVRKAVKSAMDFWMKLGVDGMRLDAIPYLHERDGTNNENLPETHDFLKELRAHLDSKFEGRMLLGEANQWPEDAVAYFGDADECHMAYHFPLMPRLFMAVQSEDRFPIVDILQQTPEIPESCQWASFLRNHDELTLEMVTDEERDYMYRSYATDPQMRVNVGIRRRLAPLLGGDRRQIELMNGLLFSLLGTPIIYYGDEIGMGDNIYLGDRNGVRTPMQWSADRNAGFSASNPHRLFLPAIIDPQYHYEFVNVESQQSNPSWLLWWMKRLIALRKQRKAFSRGTLEMLQPENSSVLAFIRQHGEERVLVVANLSRHPQAVELDLSEFAGVAPLELFGHVEFPPITEQPYLVTFAPHTFYWFDLAHDSAGGEQRTASELPQVVVKGTWHQALTAPRKPALEAVLPDFLSHQRWFAGKARVITSASVADVIPLGSGTGAPRSYLALISVTYRDGEAETYSVPIAYLAAPPDDHEPPESAGIFARIRSAEGDGYLVDGMKDERTQELILQAITKRRTAKGGRGSIVGHRTPALARLTADASSLSPQALRGEQSNSSITYGDQLILKMYRRVHPGENPDLEITRHLARNSHFSNTPQLAGHVDYRSGENAEPMTLGLLQERIEVSSDAWEFTRAELDRFYERVLGSGGRLSSPPPAPPPLVAESTEMEGEFLGTYPAAAELLGRRTAELHLALAEPRGSEEFEPLPFSELYQRSLYQAVRSDVQRTSRLLRRALPRLEGKTRELVETLLAHEEAAIDSTQDLVAAPLDGMRIRIHGDYHLGQVLYTGRDFTIIDFEGEPARPLGERRIKQSPLRDVAGMLRSFHYAAYTPVLRSETGVVLRPEEAPEMVAWADYWYRWARHSFLRGYMEVAADSGLLPGTEEAILLLLQSLMLQKVMYEVSYELNNRPDWLSIPVLGAADLLGAS